MYVAGPSNRDEAGLPSDSWTTPQSKPGAAETRLSGPGLYFNKRAADDMDNIANGVRHPAAKHPIGSLEWQSAVDEEFLKKNPGWTTEPLQIFPDMSVTVHGRKYWPPIQTTSFFNPNPPMGSGTSAAPNPYDTCYCGLQDCVCLL